MRLAVILAACAIKSFLWLRMTPLGRIILHIALWAFVAVMFSVLMKREEAASVNREFICSDPAQRQPQYDYELCEWKLRDARSPAIAHEAAR